MGMFDTFLAPCPKCGEELSEQSKDFGCCLQYFRPGSYVGGDEWSSNLTLEGTSYCSCSEGKTFYIVIREGVFIGCTYDENEAEGIHPVEKDALNAVIEAYEQDVQGGKEKHIAFKEAMDNLSDEVLKRAKQAASGT